MPNATKVYTLLLNEHVWSSSVMWVHFEENVSINTIINCSVFVIVQFMQLWTFVLMLTLSQWTNTVWDSVHKSGFNIVSGCRHWSFSGDIPRYDLYDLLMTASEPRLYRLQYMYTCENACTYYRICILMNACVPITLYVYLWTRVYRLQYMYTYEHGCTDYSICILVNTRVPITIYVYLWTHVYRL